MVSFRTWRTCVSVYSGMMLSLRTGLPVSHHSQAAEQTQEISAGQGDMHWNETLTHISIWEKEAEEESSNILKRKLFLLMENFLISPLAFYLASEKNPVLIPCNTPAIKYIST